MFTIISYINLFILLAVSIFHTVLGIVYYNQCLGSPFLTNTLIITGAIGIVLSVIALIIHRFDCYDGSNKWNLLMTCILFIYLVISSIFNSIMIFRLSTRPKDQTNCAPALYWSSTLMLIVSYAIVVITFCILINLFLLQRRH